MLTYSALVTLYLAYLGFAGGLTGTFLWLAVVLHLMLTALLTFDLARMLRDLRQAEVIATRDLGRPSPTCVPSQKSGLFATGM
jgi:hypothetical protein